MAEERSALFVRIPATQARRLDAQARSLGRTKQDFVSDLLTTSLGPPPSSGAGQQDSAEPDEVLTLVELAEMLKLDEAVVMERVATGELPGRRFGDHWRFSRAAVLGWLDGTDADRPRAGFAQRPAQFPDDGRG